MIRVKINQPNASEMFLKALKENKVIAYPTDTIYGIGTAVTNDKGIDKINEMKKRQQPMSIALANFDIIKNAIIADEHKLLKIQEILKDGSTCIANYKPGSFNNKITQDGKIGFRIPNHHFLKSVLNIYTKPITTTSINESGFEPLYQPDAIEEKFGNKIDLLLDDGIIKNNPSKIYMFTQNEIKQLR
tara:strand:- start:398 stop:961 length:564 start_codon:yes stop_codon:yes gene_type:complete